MIRVLLPSGLATVLIDSKNPPQLGLPHFLLEFKVEHFSHAMTDWVGYRHVIDPINAASNTPQKNFFISIMILVGLAVPSAIMSKRNVD